MRFGKNSINGESEEQDRIMEDYFRECAVAGFKTDKEDS